MGWKNFQVEERGRIAIVTISRPDVLNAVDYATICEMEEVLDALEARGKAQAVILTGEGEKSFIAGGDIACMARLSMVEAEQFVYKGQSVLSRWERSRLITIAAVNGYALGGGTEIALAMDLRVASDRAVFGLPEVTVGLFPGWGGTQRLTRLIGKGRAKEIIFTGRRLSAEEAYNIGLVNAVVPAQELIPYCESLAGKILENSLVAVRQAKKAINEGAEISLAQGLCLEAECWLINFATADRKEGLNAFLEKRKPCFQEEM